MHRSELAPLFPILPRAESAYTFEAIVDPYTRDVLGHHLLVPGASATRTFDLACTWLARRAPDAATPLFVGVSVSDAELYASSLGRAAGELRRRGVSPSELRVVLDVGTDLTGLTVLFDAAQRAGVGCVVAATTTATIALANLVPRGTVLAPIVGPLSRTLPIERAHV